METTPLSRAERLAMQDAWLDRRMQDNPRWAEGLNNLPKLHPVHERKVFVAWCPSPAGRPQVIDILRTLDVTLSFTGGLTLIFSSRNDPEGLARASSLPREIAAGVFAWIPPTSEIRYCPFKSTDPTSTWRCTVPMMVRADGQVRLSALKEFRALWPDVSL